MIALLMAALSGIAIALVLERSTASTFDTRAMLRSNYRGTEIPTGVGVLVVLTLMIVGAVILFVTTVQPSVPTWATRSVPMTVPTLFTAIAFCLLGLIDDVLGQGQSGGFRGHLRALTDGQLTSGMIKMLGGGVVAIVIASMTHGSGSSWWALLRDGAVIALAANLANLFDRAPGRTIKVTTLWFVLVTAVSRDGSLSVCAAGIGAGVGLLRGDLRERYMLGDAGSNVLGALCGLSMLVVTGPDTLSRWVVLVVLALLNATSEFVSFTKVIDSVGPLRWFDRLGSERAD